MKTPSLARLAVLTALLLHSVPQVFGFGEGSNTFATATLANDNNVLFSDNTTLTAFTAEAGEPAHGPVTGAQKTAWWTYTAPESGYLSVDTFRSLGAGEGVLDTVLAVYTGNAVNALTLVGRNDDYGVPGLGSGTGLSSVSVFIQAGTTYRIAVDGYDNSAITATNFKVVLSVRLLPLRKLVRNGTFNFTNAPELAGALTFTTTGTGAFTGKLTMGTKITPLAGVFGTDGLATFSIVRPVAPGLTPLAPMTLVIDGTLEGDAYFFVPGQNEFAFSMREVAVFNPLPSNTLVGYYTATADFPGADGFLTATVKSNGAVTGTFTSPDGLATPFSTTLHRTETVGTFSSPFYKSLHAGKGFLSQTLTFVEVGAVDPLTVSGSYRRPPAKPGVLFYPAGLTVGNFGLGGTYVKPVVGARALGFLDGTAGVGNLNVTDVGGELGGNITEALTLSTLNKFTFNSLVRKPVLTLNTATGLVTGSIEAPPLKKRTIKGILRLNGAVLALRGYATGTAQNFPMTVTPP